MSIEVRVAGKGVVRGEEVERADIAAHCDVHDGEADMVVSITPELYACRDCLRARLDATSVASWRLRDPGKGLPWGSIAG